MKPGKTILTVFFAASAGLLTGLLFAQKKGENQEKNTKKGEDTIYDMVNSVNHHSCTQKPT